MMALADIDLRVASKSEITAEGHKTPEVLKLNPRGQVPVFKDGDLVVSESLAAIQYLEEAYPEPCLMTKEASSEVSQATSVNTDVFAKCLTYPYSLFSCAVLSFISVLIPLHCQLYNVAVVACPAL